MDNVVEFPKEQNEKCKCDLCELTDEFVSYISVAESQDEIHEIVRDLVSISRNMGYKDAILDDLDNKIKFLDQFEEDIEE